jgi:hypothetical protein
MRWAVVAVGDCAFDSHAVAGGVSAVVPVDLHICGCPPPPLQMLRGLLSLLAESHADAKKLAGAPGMDHCRLRRRARAIRQREWAMPPPLLRPQQKRKFRAIWENAPVPVSRGVRHHSEKVVAGEYRREGEVIRAKSGGGTSQAVDDGDHLHDARAERAHRVRRHER